MASLSQSQLGGYKPIESPKSPETEGVSDHAAQAEATDTPVRHSPRHHEVAASVLQSSLKGGRGSPSSGKLRFKAEVVGATNSPGTLMSHLAATSGRATTVAVPRDPRNFQLHYFHAERNGTQEALIEKALLDEAFIDKSLDVLTRFEIPVTSDSLEEKQASLKEYIPIIGVLTEIDSLMRTCEPRQGGQAAARPETLLATLGAARPAAPLTARETVKAKRDFARLLSFIISESKIPIPGTQKRGRKLGEPIKAHSLLFRENDILTSYVIPRLITLHNTVYPDATSPYLEVLETHHKLTPEQAQKVLPEAIIFGELLTTTFKNELTGLLTHLGNGISLSRLLTLVSVLHKEKVTEYVVPKSVIGLFDRQYIVIIRDLLHNVEKMDPSTIGLLARKGYDGSFLENLKTESFSTSLERMNGIYRAHEFENKLKPTLADVHNVLQNTNPKTNPSSMVDIAHTIMRKWDEPSILFLVMHNNALTPRVIQEMKPEEFFTASPSSSDPAEASGAAAAASGAGRAGASHTHAIPEEFTELLRSHQELLIDATTPDKKEEILYEFLIEAVTLAKANSYREPFYDNLMALLLPFTQSVPLTRSSGVSLQFVEGQKIWEKTRGASTKSEEIAFLNDIFRERTVAIRRDQTITLGRETFGEHGVRFLIPRALTLLEEEPEDANTLLIPLAHFITRSDATWAARYQNCLQKHPPSLTEILAAEKRLTRKEVEIFQQHGLPTLLNIERSDIDPAIIREAAVTQLRVSAESDFAKKAELLMEFLLSHLPKARENIDEPWAHPLLACALPFGQKIDDRELNTEILEEIDTLISSNTFLGDPGEQRFPKIAASNLGKSYKMAVLLDKRIRQQEGDSPVKTFYLHSTELVPSIHPVAVLRVYEELYKAPSGKPLSVETSVQRLTRSDFSSSRSAGERILRKILGREMVLALPEEKLGKIKHCIWEQLGCPDTAGADTSGDLIRSDMGHEAIQKGLQIYVAAESALVEFDTVENSSEKAFKQLHSLLITNRLPFFTANQKVTLERYAQEMYDRLDPDLKNDIAMKLWIFRGKRDGDDVSKIIEEHKTGYELREILPKIQEAPRVYFTDGMSGREKMTAITGSAELPSEMKFYQAMTVRPDASMDIETLKGELRAQYAALSDEIRATIGKKIYELDGERSTDLRFGDRTIETDPLADLPQLAIARLRCS